MGIGGFGVCRGGIVVMVAVVRRGVAVVVALGLGAAGALVSGPIAESAVPTLTEISFAGGPFSVISNAGVLDRVSDGSSTYGATDELWSSPAVGDVTGDGTPEIVVGGLTSIVRVYGIDGNLLVSINPGGGNWSTQVGATHASPALADMNGDGVLDIVIANTGGVLASYSFSGGSLTQIANINVGKYASNFLSGMVATPAIGYVNGDTKLDVVTTSWGQLMDAWSGPGLGNIPSIRKWMLDTIWSSPALGDVDGDGAIEIVYGSDCEGASDHPWLDPRCKAGWRADGMGGGFITAVNLDGSVQWSFFVDNAVVWSSPALSDLNGDGKLDVVVGTGVFWQVEQAKRVIAINGATGGLLWAATTSGIAVGSPSVGEVDGGGHPEVFIVTRGGCLVSYDGENGNVRSGFPVSALDSGSCGGGSAATHGGVSLADIDGDGVIEAVVQGEQSLKVYNASTGALETTVRSTYDHTLYAGAGTPTIASVNGQTWIVSALRGSGSDNQRDDDDDLVVTVWRSNSALGSAPWPTFKQNNQRTSNAIAQAAPDNTVNENFVRQMYRDFLGREASSGEVSHWADRLASRQTDRYGFATTLSRSDEWISTVITQFYRDTLGREPDAAGLRGWIDAARAGMPTAQIASAFYASPEYFQTVGNSDYRTWVEDLYRKLLLREGENSGVDGWVRALGAGMARDSLAFGFYQSPETLGVRITALYADLLGRSPEPGAIPNWSPFVAKNGDLVLAAAIAASQEYLNYAQTPH
jgi:hypothetical protein